MNKRVLTGILAVLLFLAGFVRADAAVNYHEGEVEEYLIEQLAAANIPGGSLSIVTSQKEIYSVAFGDVKETSSDLQIGALTRTFTTLAIMQLIEKGDIRLEDRLKDYGITAEESGGLYMSVKDLLSYTEPADDVKPIAGLELYNITPEEFVTPSVNVKFNLLGKVIEKVSGKSYADYIKENITGPLGMQSTYSIDEPGASADITPGSKNYFGLPIKDGGIPGENGYWLGIPSNGLVSDVKDMGKYMQMYLSAGGKIISYNTVDLIMGEGKYSGKSIFGTKAYYSMGWTVTEAYGEKIYYCNGSVDNYTSAMFVIPSRDIGITILFNSSDVLTGQKFTDIIEAGVVSLVMGNTASPVSANAYLMEHAAADIIYFFAVVCSLLPLLMMEVWTRCTREKFSIIRLLLDIILHIVLPTSLIFLVSYYIAPWNIIIRVMPDLFFVATGVIGLLYLGAIVKFIAYFIIKRHAGDEDEEENTDAYGTEDEKEEKEAKERKDRLLNRMRGIKDAGKEEEKDNSVNTTETSTVQVTDSTADIEKTPGTDIDTGKGGTADIEKVSITDSKAGTENIENKNAEDKKSAGGSAEGESLGQIFGDSRTGNSIYDRQKDSSKKTGGRNKDYQPKRFIVDPPSEDGKLKSGKEKKSQADNSKKADKTGQDNKLKRDSNNRSNIKKGSNINKNGSNNRNNNISKNNSTSKNINNRKDNNSNRNGKGSQNNKDRNRNNNKNGSNNKSSSNRNNKPAGKNPSVKNSSRYNSKNSLKNNVKNSTDK